MKAAFQQAAGLQYLEVDPVESGPASLVVVLHGRGANAQDLADVAGVLAMPGCRFIFPNAPLAIDLGPWGVGYAWYELGAAQDQTVPRSREQLLTFLDEVARRYATPLERTVLAGFSQGAVMTLDVGLRTREPLAGLVAMSGCLHRPEEVRALLPTVGQRRILLIHGTEDEVVPVSGSRQARLALEEAGLSPEYHEFPMGHEVTAESLAVVGAFLRRVLGHAPA